MLFHQDNWQTKPLSSFRLKITVAENATAGTPLPAGSPIREAERQQPKWLKQSYGNNDPFQEFIPEPMGGHCGFSTGAED